MVRVGLLPLPPLPTVAALTSLWATSRPGQGCVTRSPCAIYSELSPLCTAPFSYVTPARTPWRPNWPPACPFHLPTSSHRLLRANLLTPPGSVPDLTWPAAPHSPALSPLTPTAPPAPSGHLSRLCRLPGVLWVTLSLPLPTPIPKLHGASCPSQTWAPCWASAVGG